MKVLIADSHLPSLQAAYFGLLYQDYEVEATTNMNPAEIRPRIDRFRPDVLVVSHVLVQRDPERLCRELAGLPLPVIITVNDPEGMPGPLCPGTKVIQSPADLPQLMERIEAAASDKRE